MDYTYQIVTNLSCNLDCAYCYERKYTSKNDVDAVVDFLHACFERDKHLPPESGAIIDVIGGEPFLQPKLLVAAFETAEELSLKYNRPFIFSISTNATLFDRKANRDIVERWASKMSIGVSIDGIQANHDKYRIYVNTGKGSYDKVIEGYNYLKTLGLRELGVKATFTNETKGDFATSMKHLIDLSGGRGTVSGNITYEDVLSRQEALNLANQQIEVLEYWISKGYHVDPRSILTHMAGEGVGPLGWYPAARDELRNNLELRNDPERIRPWCGSVKYMTCLGFDRKIYGCNRFMSGINDRHAIANLVGREFVPVDTSNLAKEIESQYLDYPDSCVGCPSKSSCASCAAAPYEEGDGSVEARRAYHAKRRQCGWTMAKVLVMQWWKQRFGSYDSQQDKSVCYCPECVAKREALEKKECCGGNCSEEHSNHSCDDCGCGE